MTKNTQIRDIRLYYVPPNKTQIKDIRGSKLVVCVSRTLYQPRPRLRAGLSNQIEPREGRTRVALEAHNAAGPVVLPCSELEVLELQLAGRSIGRNITSTVVSERYSVLRKRFNYRDSYRP